MPTVSSAATGSFHVKINNDDTAFDYTLEYDGPFDANPAGGTVIQSHIHLGRAATNGGISVFLCANPSAAPMGTPTPPVCPPACNGHGT